MSARVPSGSGVRVRRPVARPAPLSLAALRQRFLRAARIDLGERVPDELDWDLVDPRTAPPRYRPVRAAREGAWRWREIPFGDELNDSSDYGLGDPRFAEEEGPDDGSDFGFGSEVDTGQLRLVMAPEDGAMNEVVLDPRGLPAPGLAAPEEGSSASLAPPSPPPPPPATVDEAAAAVLLASAFHRRDGLLRAMWRADERASEGDGDRFGTSLSGTSPSVLLRLPDMRLSRTLWRAVRAGVLGVYRPLGATSLLGPTPRDVAPERAAVGLLRDPGERRVALRSAGDDDLVESLARALTVGVPVVVTLPADETELIERVAPLVDHDLTLPAFTPSVVGAIVDLVTRPAEVLHPFKRGRTPAMDEGTMDVAKMDLGARPHRPSPVRGVPADVTLRDLRASVHAGRGRRGSIARLRRIARARHEGADGPATAKKSVRAAAEGASGGAIDGPPLEQLEGYGEAKAIGLQIAGDLRAFGEDRVPWGEIDRGLVLAGPPGTGKTTYARALAKSAGASYFAGSYSEWQRHGHLGDLLREMASTFEDARKAAPSVLLIDEIDAFQRRDGGSTHTSEYMAQCVNALLQHLDGAVSREGVLVIGATNHVERVDPAILRSGRLERIVPVDVPDVDGLVDVLRSLLRSNEAEAIVDGAKAIVEGTKAITDGTNTITDGANVGAERERADGKAREPEASSPNARLSAALLPLALQAAGASHADAAAIVRRARAAARRDSRSLTLADLTDAVAAERPPLSAVTERRAAVHEAGHVVAAVATGVVTPLAAWLGSHGGATKVGGELELTTPALMRARLTFLLAGREAERMAMGAPSDGAGGPETSDLARATIMAVRGVATSGLGDGPPLWTPGLDDPAASVPERHADEVAGLLTSAERDARNVVHANRRIIERVADALIERRRLDHKTIVEMTEGVVRTGSSAEAPRDRDGPERTDELMRPT